MDCVKPVLAWRTGRVKCKLDGQISPKLEFSPREAERYFKGRFGALWMQAMHDAEMTVACGRCPNCLARKRAFKSLQLCHERASHEHACFVTLTYDESHVPTTDSRPLQDPNKVLTIGVADDSCIRTLLPDDVQRFLKRLRSHLTYVPKRKKDYRDHVARIRYFVVGEYGSRTQRPHYHLIIFGWWPSDAVPWSGHNFISPQIAKLWKFGHHLVSQVTDGACRYCAQYVTKKLVKRSSWMDGRRVPEFIRQSTSGGSMGVPWFYRFAVHCARVGYVTYRSGPKIFKSALPPAYIRCLRKYFPAEWLAWRDRAVHVAQNGSPVNPDVLISRAKLNEIRAKECFDRGIL